MSIKETDFPLNRTPEEREKSKLETKCHICGRKSTNPHGKKGFCSGMIVNPNFKQEMEEYNQIEKTI